MMDLLRRHRPTCERTWPSPAPTRSDDTTRQHHRGDCECRYCGTRRWIGGEE